jgi:sialate O-acetylesterase
MAETNLRLSPLLGSGAVVQREEPVTVTGMAQAGDLVTISVGRSTRKVQADEHGRYAATFPARSVGDAFDIVARTATEQTESRNLVAGDVFLCSGQSNMELEVRHAQDAIAQVRASADPGLRLMTIPRAVADQPQLDFLMTPRWETAGPDSVPGFSAACYYMARDLRKSAGVPIGAIASSWGGSQISPWMGEQAQAAVGNSAQSALLARHARNPIDGERAASEQWENWWRQATGDQPGAEPWQSDAPISWADAPAMGAWENWGVASLANYNGMVWFRRDFVLTAAQADGMAALSLGTLDDVGRAWINGKPVGMGAQAWQPTTLTVPPGVMKAGRNTLILNVVDNYASGGLLGPAEAMALQPANGDAVPLGNGWRYAVARTTPPGAPRVPWSDVTGTSTLYNGMIAPLGAIKLKGVAWYQGESDTDIPGYADRLRAMMADWRRQFGQPDLAFAVVQLAAYGEPATQPGESGWARLRGAQRKAVAADPHAGLATAIDLGDPFDIHPGEKQELGRRLARVMRAVAYNAPVSRSGPQAAGATATADGGATVRFSGLEGGLRLRSGAQAVGFELCGSIEGSCRYALAQVVGDQVRLTGDGKPVTRVRYAWADYPVMNLYDETPLPVGPFDIPVER